MAQNLYGNKGRFGEGRWKVYLANDPLLAFYSGNAPPAKFSPHFPLLILIFAELAQRVALNTGANAIFAPRYGLLAFKLSNLLPHHAGGLGEPRQPCGQTIRPVHLGNGGQAVIADQFHNHAGAKENARSSEKPMQQGPGGWHKSALPSPDAGR